jgi:hypothetical protein
MPEERTGEGNRWEQLISAELLSAALICAVATYLAATSKALICV